MSTVEQGQALASVIEYITGYPNVDVDSIEKNHVKFTFNAGEYTISVQAIREGIARIRREFQLVYSIDGLEGL